jgi:alkylhydroperoxidase family enzyme
VGSDLGLSEAQLVSVAGELDPMLFTEPQLAALAYADAMTLGDVDDDLFVWVREHFDTDTIVELTETIAWENASARFNRALRIPSQNLWSSDL